MCDIGSAVPYQKQKHWSSVLGNDRFFDKIMSLRKLAIRSCDYPHSSFRVRVCIGCNWLPLAKALQERNEPRKDVWFGKRH